MKNAYIPIALALIGLGLLLGGDSMPTMPGMPDWINPLNWFDAGPVAVCIIEETKDSRTPLEPDQAALINSTTFPKEIAAKGGSFLGCFDKDSVDRDHKVPEALIPYLEAAKKLGQLPAMVYKRGSKVTAVPLPLNEKTALEILQ